MMVYSVFTAQGDLLYNGGSWPMARAALDLIVLENKGVPQLLFLPGSKPAEEA